MGKNMYMQRFATKIAGRIPRHGGKCNKKIKVDLARRESRAK
jgi:hypothetical protein